MSNNGLLQPAPVIFPDNYTISQDDDGSGESILGTHNALTAVAGIRSQTNLRHSINEAPKHKILGNYALGRTVGEGSFAKVKLATHRLTNQEVAIKIIEKAKLDEYSLKNMNRETNIMKQIDHPHIIHLYEIIETKKELNIVLEYAAGGEVLDYIVARGKLKESEARRFVRQIVSALEYMHSCGIVHRDLKVYSAPELIEGKSYVGPEVDMWSLGVNLYAMVVGDLPFSNNNLKVLYEMIQKGKYSFPDFVSYECKDLISKLLTVNPKKRFTCRDVKEHQWFTEGINIIEAQQSSSKKEELVEADLDQLIIDQIELMGVERSKIVASILGKTYDQTCGTYNIMLASKLSKARAPAVLQEPEGDETLTPTYEFNQPVPKVIEKSLKKQPPHRNKGFGEKKPATPRKLSEGDNLDNLARIMLKVEAVEEKKNTEKSTAVLRPIRQSRVRTATSTSEAGKNSPQLDKRPATRQAPRSPHSLTLPPIALDSKKRSKSSTFASTQKSDTTEKSATSERSATPSFAFNASTTSTLDPEAIATRIELVLNKNNVKFEVDASVATKLYICTLESISFEMEIRELKSMGLNGIRCNRISGDIWAYKELCTKITSDLRL